jgi:hypothetical protein
MAVVAAALETSSVSAGEMSNEKSDLAVHMTENCQQLTECLVELRTYLVNDTFSGQPLAQPPSPPADAISCTPY